MPYAATIPVEFHHDRLTVYRALCDLKQYPLWNSGLVYISEPGPLRPGMRYETESIVAGHTNRSAVEVVRLVEPSEIELVSHTGVITYRALFQLTEIPGGHTKVTCILTFTLHNFVLDLARSVIESMAKTRVGADLETLRALIDNAPH